MKKSLSISAILLFALSSWTKAQDFAPIALSKQITHVQPMTGLVFWPDNDHMQTLGGSISLEFSYCLPSAVVTGKNGGVVQYNWSSFDALLDDIASRGHQAVIRFRYEYPNGEKIGGKRGATAVPQYIKNLQGYTETYSSNPGGDGPTYYADWSNLELQWFTKQFYTDLQARYGSDPRIAFLEVGFGHWSEYHIYGTKLNLGHNFPSKQYQSEFFQHLDTTMTIPWLVSVDAGDDSYSPLQTDAAMSACTFGLFDDSFMHSKHDFSQGEGWNEQCWRWSDPNNTRWHTGVNGGEVSYYTSSDQHNFLNPAGMYGVTWEQAAAKYHITFINANDAPEGRYATAQRVQEAGLASGYRFAVTAAESNGSSTRLTVTNEGVAPIYYDAYFAIGSVRATESLRGLLPGASLTVTIAAVGEPQIVCDHLLPSSEIQYRAELSGVTALEDMESIEPTIKRVLPNGQMVIEKGGKTYNLTGGRLK